MFQYYNCCNVYPTTRTIIANNRRSLTFYQLFCIQLYDSTKFTCQLVVSEQWLQLPALLQPDCELNFILNPRYPSGKCTVTRHFMRNLIFGWQISWQTPPAGCRAFLKLQGTARQWRAAGEFALKPPHVWEMRDFPGIRYHCPVSNNLKICFFFVEIIKILGVTLFIVNNE